MNEIQRRVKLKIEKSDGRKNDFFLVLSSYYFLFGNCIQKEAKQLRSHTTFPTTKIEQQLFSLLVEQNLDRIDNVVFLDRDEKRHSIELVDCE